MVALFIYCQSSCFRVRGRTLKQASYPAFNRCITKGSGAARYDPSTGLYPVFAIRLVTYAGGAPLICGVEEQETRPNEFTHIFAHPDLARLPIIGPGMGRSRTHYGSRTGCDIYDFDHCRRGGCSAETDGNSRIYH